MSDIKDLRDTIVPKSDQLNADQLLSGPITITVTGIRRGSADQPIVIGYHGDNGRPYKPCKTMRKVIIFAWGEDGNKWIGRSMTLFNEPSVQFGGIAVGGIRISHMSDIERELKASLTTTRGKKELFIIQKLEVTEKAASPALVKKYRDRLEELTKDGLTAIRTAWAATPENIKKELGAEWWRTQEEAAHAEDIAAFERAEQERLAAGEAE